MSDPSSPLSVSWVATDLDGTIVSFGVSSVVPAGAQAVTKEQLNTVQATAPQKCRLVRGVLTVVPWPAQGPDAPANAQASALLLIDAQAERARAGFLTPGSGQSLEHAATKDDAARALAASGALDPADYPWLVAEQGALAAVGPAPSLLDVAHGVQATMAQWSVAGSAIKRVRRTAKLEVAAATTVEAVQAALYGLQWPSVP